MQYKPRKFHSFAIAHELKHPESGLFMDMGLGKTAVTLTCINTLLYCRFKSYKILVIAPKKVALSVWPAELKQWDHLKNISHTLIAGNPKQRIKALSEKTDLHIIGVDNIVWLVSQFGGAWPYDYVVIDELSFFKSWKTARFKALEQVRPQIKRICGLTGTPAPNSYLDLWAPMKLLDRGERLGKYITHYKDRFFVSGYDGFSYKMRTHEKDGKEPGSYYEKVIGNKISDICISMQSEDYLDLPPLITNPVNIFLPANIQRQYDDFKKELVLEILDEEHITAANAAVLTNKLLQFANGAIYREDKSYIIIHDEKIDALEEIVETAMGQPVLVAYAWRHDKERILKRFKKLRPSLLRTTGDIYDWNRKKIKLAVVHPKSAGHGLNLQFGGHIAAWYGLTFSSEQRRQFKKRLHRDGQTNAVLDNYIIAKKTMDERAMSVLHDKQSKEARIMHAVKALIKEVKFG